MKLVALVLGLIIVASGASGTPREESIDVKLYAMDCGRLIFENLGPFSDSGEYDGVGGSLMAPCYLIRHPKGDLLWEAGLGDQYAANLEGVQLANYRAVVTRTVASQLEAIGLRFEDIEWFAFSHGHADHLGNADKLASATWIVNAKELAWLTSMPSPPRTNPALLSQFARERSVVIEGDHDVFGDGTVKILATPGHTPGHQSLLVRLAKSGSVILSGDLYHTTANRVERRMPIFNVDRADTLASMERIERIIRHRHARLIIQHSPEDLSVLPSAPDRLD